MSKLLTLGVVQQGSLLNSNSAPTDISLDNSDIDENNSIGDVIGAFSTTDADVGDTFTYTLVEGEGDTDNASFTIEGANLKAGAVFDYETKSSYSIRVKVTDSAENTFEKQFTITINDVAEPPDAAPTGLTLTVVDRTDIKLDWTDNATNEDGYKIERSADGENFTVIGTVAADVETYTDEDLDELTKYYYRVRAYKGTEYSAYTDIENETTGSPAFIITVKTDNAGTSNDNQFTIPTTGVGYNYSVVTSEQSLSGQTGNCTLTWTNPGTYQVKIYATTGFPRIYFNNVGDKEKLLSIDNWGSIKWSSFTNAFRGCVNLSQCVGNADTSNVDSFSMAFYDCNGLTSIDTSNWDTSNVDSFYAAFLDCRILTSIDTSNWDTSKVTSFKFAFVYCYELKGDFSGLDLDIVTNINLIFGSSDINETGTTTNYDNTLVGWANQTVNSGLSPSFGSSKYGQGKVDEGTTDGTTANKLVDSSQNFLTTVTVGDVIHNTTDGTYARVTAVDSDTTLSLDHDIMVSGEAYVIQHSDAAKARASLILDDGWVITDGGAA